MNYGFCRLKARHAGILVKAVAEVAAAKKGPALMIQFRQLPLGADCIQRENRMLVSCRIEDARRVDIFVAVERDNIVPPLGDSLLGIHPVVGGGATVLVPILMGMTAAESFFFDSEVPGCPG